MEIQLANVSNSKVLVVTPSGNSSTPTISRGWNIPTFTNDFELINKRTKDNVPFFVTPLTEGSIVVGLADDSGTPYTISEIEVTAFIGQPMLYLIKKIYKAGTTVTSFNIGI